LVCEKKKKKDRITRPKKEKKEKWRKKNQKKMANLESESALKRLKLRVLEDIDKPTLTPVKPSFLS